MDRRKQITSFCPPPVIPQHLRQIAGGPKLPHPSLLLSRDLQRFAEAMFGVIHAPQEQEQTGGLCRKHIVLEFQLLLYRLSNGE
ncbi:hypothetical protein MAE02_41600 [Microvirga aerophila]|uniref:Uncharacterized protein n=1 Tax=Microvirga aerophila TaxID=670291 RepID=A0A512BWY8_9HYPH|nr:hypothetical protein [Microvirga aerophila]GEO16464.1 hypothetical protein MAE02_41600 [Microvirga aerophila]